MKTRMKFVYYITIRGGGKEEGLYTREFVVTMEKQESNSFTMTTPHRQWRRVVEYTLEGSNIESVISLGGEAKRDRETDGSRPAWGETLVVKAQGKTNAELLRSVGREAASSENM